MTTVAVRTLDGFAGSDERIRRVYVKARQEYDAHALEHHNFLHIVRDLHRALVIADDEPGVDYAVLIPAVLLHDIGFFEDDFRALGHDVTGARLARQWLQDIGGYTEEQVAAICHCIRAHKGKAETPRSLEARILYDADVLEKAGVAYLLLGGKVLCEFNETIEHFLTREVRDRAREASKGFYTRKGKELDAGRLDRTSRLIAEVQQELQSDRADLLLDESILWTGRPPE